MSAHRFAPTPTSTPGTTCSCAASAMWFLCGTLRILARRDAAYKAIRSGRQKDRLAGNLTDSNDHCRPSWRNAREKTWKPRSAHKNGMTLRATPAQQSFRGPGPRNDRSPMVVSRRLHYSTLLPLADPAGQCLAQRAKRSDHTPPRPKKPHPSPQNQVVRNLSEIAHLMNEVNKRTQRRRQMPVTGIVEA